MTVAIIDPKKIRAELRALGLNQREFAARHHLREADVSVVCNGHAVSPATLYDVARALEHERRGAA